MATCQTDTPFYLTHLANDRYLLLLPPNLDRNQFLLQHKNHLHYLGYVPYPWSPRVNAFPLRLKYKVWI